MKESDLGAIYRYLPTLEPAKAESPWRIAGQAATDRGKGPPDYPFSRIPLCISCGGLTSAACLVIGAKSVTYLSDLLSVAQSCDKRPRGRSSPK